MTATTTFHYKAKSPSGQTVTGVVEAYDEFDAVSRIKADCPIVLSVREVRQRTSRELFSPAVIKPKNLALICSQFSIILGAGLPTVRTVELVAEQTGDKALKKILLDVAADVAAGHSLAESFENKGKTLPTTFIETIRAGEQSGTLDTSFHNLQTYYEKAARTREKVVSALIYPIFLAVIAAVVVAVLMIVVIPMFVTMFESMEIALPLLTRILIAVSNFLVRFWLPLFGGIALAVIVLKVWGKTPAGRKFFARLRMKIPLLGKVERMNAASQFAGTMSTLLSAGVGMTGALAITSRVMDNYLVSLYVRDMVAGVEEGRPLGQCMTYCPYLPHLLTEMTGVGEATGSLERTLTIIGDYYDNEVQLSVSRLLSILEPAIIVCMAVVAVTIVFGFYLPMFTMYANMA